eukprot:UN25591
MVFNNLHMMHFLKYWKITTAEVVACQVIYLFWNTANDVFAGFFIDWWCRKLKKTKIKLALYNSLIWSIASLLPFYNLGLPVSIHYFISISLFDGCSSLSGVLMGSILATYTDSEKERIQFQRLNSVFGCFEFFCTLYGFKILFC